MQDFLAMRNVAAESLIVDTMLISALYNDQPIKIYDETGVSLIKL